jgi:anti-sigma regulatory factor (Ser/Thr protein kinase)
MERDFVDNINTLRNGNHLVMGRDAVYLLEAGSYRLSILDIPASLANSNRAFERTDGLVWVATQRGLDLLDARLGHLGMAAPEGSDPAVWTGYLRANGNILFPTVQGLYEGSWDGRSIRIRKATDAFDKAFVNSLYEDRNGRIWASSEKGILFFNPANRQMSVLDYADNIQGYGFNGNGPMLQSSGLLFWGGTNGINYLEPETYALQADQLRVYIEHARHGAHDSILYDLSKTAELPFASRSLEVEWKAPYFNNPEKIRYHYRIRGLDETWKFLGNNNRLRLTAIPPGRYQLDVQATVDALHWVDVHQPLAFIVTEPFWRRGWFLALCAGIAAAALWLLAESRNRKRARKREAEHILAETRQKIADAEMQALRAQMNPHFIFNCLNSINRYIVKSDQATASLYLTRFAKLIRLILDNSNSRTVSLSNELEALKLYVEMESIRFEKQFTWEISVDRNVQPDTIHVPPLIIQPYVENAIWHGLLHKETAGHLRVHVCCGSDRLLEVIIEDNGVGREAAKKLRSKTVSGNKSLGMKLTEERLRLLDRNMALSATVEVEDLYEKDGTARGTRVLLTIPLDRE